MGLSSGKTTKTKVLVLGAGPAGVSFSNTLFDNGKKDFMVLEANNYIGGRMRNVKIGNLTIEAGAGWLHDIGPHNPLYVLKTKIGLKATADDYSDIIARFVSGFAEIIFLGRSRVQI